MILKYKESILFAGAIILTGTLFTTFFENTAWIKLVIICAASVLTALGVYFKEKRISAEKNEIVEVLKGMSKQQKEVIEEFMQSNDAKMNEITKSIDEGMKGVQVTLNTNHNKEYELINQQLNDVIEEMKSLQVIAERQIKINDTMIQSQQKSLEHVSLTIEKGNEASINLTDNLTQGVNKLIDTIQDLEGQINRQVKHVIEEIENGNDAQDEFHETMVKYQGELNGVSEDIRKYRDNIELDISERMEVLKNLVLQLSETVDQLADSKHHERERALGVQKKLAEQFERLKARA
ncbi:MULTISPECIES: hypothetical protein [Bacillus]|uniref:hypothetical protein n=1 Tax=Bacillus TaxID=1386 RepID=UPI00202CB58A|nr:MULTISPECIES: hypothetical protein [Bacillus cereus group]MCM0001650.1 hypothetical protein [Bacillus paranthracis]MCU5171789.1 hypothetical protein [Bacillus paranthracis]MDA1953417.1 hypothetical protein [Bacillus cereus group sp. BcHK114]MED1167158.1 hypothetical protein [Bacillus paranthracis]